MKFTLSYLSLLLLLGYLPLYSQDSPISNEVSAWQKMEDKSRFKKGSLFIGANISFYDAESQNDYIVANIDLTEVDKKGLNSSFVIGYFLNPLMSVGVRGNYGFAQSSQILDADFLNTAFNATQYKTESLRNRSEIHAFMRNYVPLGDAARFYIFNETSFYWLLGNNYQRATRNPGMTDETISTIESRTQGLGFGTSLGVTYFSSKSFAMELQLGTTGLEVQFKDILKENIEPGRSTKVGFRNGLNFLNVQMGFTYYFNLN